MPVIGRLDGQVDELIIKPISDRRRGEEPPPDTHAETDAPAAPPGEAPRAPAHTPGTDESSGERGELPVWLL